jgi:hypothetical protein
VGTGGCCKKTDADEGHGLKVDWYPWCEDAFTKAQAEDKPVFLSGIIISLLSLT